MSTYTRKIDGVEVENQDWVATVAAGPDADHGRVYGIQGTMCRVAWASGVETPFDLSMESDYEVYTSPVAASEAAQ